MSVIEIIQGPGCPVHPAGKFITPKSIKAIINPAHFFYCSILQTPIFSVRFRLTSTESRIQEILFGNAYASSFHFSFRLSTWKKMNSPGFLFDLQIERSLGLPEMCIISLFTHLKHLFCINFFQELRKIQVVLKHRKISAQIHS